MALWLSILVFSRQGGGCCAEVRVRSPSTLLFCSFLCLFFYVLRHICDSRVRSSFKGCLYYFLSPQTSPFLSIPLIDCNCAGFIACGLYVYQAQRLVVEWVSRWVGSFTKINKFRRSTSPPGR